MSERAQGSTATAPSGALGGALNLTEAANTLGVHYQTVYKWVRSGELTALRVGGRYEISKTATARFLATRSCIVAEIEIPTAQRRATDLTQDDALEALEATATNPIVTGASVTNFAARRAAEVLGQMCLVAVMGADGRRVTHATVDHADSQRAGFVTALFDKTDGWPTINRGGMASAAYTTV